MSDSVAPRQILSRELLANGSGEETIRLATWAITGGAIRQIIFLSRIVGGLVSFWGAIAESYGSCLKQGRPHSRGGGERTLRVEDHAS